MNEMTFGISGLAAYVPPYRVDLEAWCRWTDGDWSKISAVVGRSFRMRSPEHSVYTLAANAVLRLIRQYDIDPRAVGYLALGTESSTDNAAGAVIVRGLVDQGLTAEGRPRLARDCEVPEFKHACLGGVYALKAGLRYLAFDGCGRKAIVVSGDVAEYARGSSGEPTQGAGAIAMFLEEQPKLLALDLQHAGSASDYRGLDFRKPFLRFSTQQAGCNGHLQDLPVFNGKYSTTCYIDETLAALNAMFARNHFSSRSGYFRDLAAVFMHRPYHHMPHNAWAMGYLFALAHDAEHVAAAHEELAGYCATSQVRIEDVLEEARSEPAVARTDGGDLSFEAYPNATLALKVFRKSPTYRTIVNDKMQYGSDTMMELGNLYTAALPAWLAAGLEDAATRGVALEGRNLLVMGYGSGDAAEAIPARVVEGWQRAARAIHFREALAGAVDLSAEQYAALHAGQAVEALQDTIRTGFVIDRVGTSTAAKFQDFGIEYYRYAGRI
ncbi:MAG: hydroxymethylglutaryl-CoA synthase [Nevskiaceae bacterium]|nr:MAG: hydroxymethylglutaryl-CoA synthase [Nevskiaceae bacterium]TBR71790.1 MAG: hydroxymethylglutaryl-CoA synthase [Nevskiaceae bacterium]